MKRNTAVYLEYRCKAFSCEHGPRDQDLLVEKDGTVRVYDSVGELYTTCHSISDVDQGRIREIARTPSARANGDRA